MLSAGNYSGIEGEKALVTAGIEKEMLFDLVEKKNPTFIYNYDFNFEGCSGYDYAIAQSLFTHLTLEDIRKCFVNLYPISNDGGKFYFTFFEGDESKNIHTASHANKNWQYNFASLKNIAEECGFRVEYIGDWGHEKEQMMAVAIK